MEFFQVMFVTFYFGFKTTSADCLDSDFRCGYWASIHQCEVNPAYMVTTCPWSCNNHCECPDVYTVDQACDCLLRAKNGECESNQLYLNNICKSTCDTRLTTSCPLLPAPIDANAGLSTTDTWYLTAVDEVCNPGYESVVPAHKGRKLCGKEGSWIVDQFFDTRVECKRVDCGEPPDIQHGTRMYTSTLYESTVTYTCDLGYRKSTGHLVRTCNQSALWSRSLPVCEVRSTSYQVRVIRRQVNAYTIVITCPGPPLISYASRIGSSNVYNTTIEYSCNTGYNHSDGDLQRRCQLNGEWSGSPPVCSIIHCPVLEFVTHASLSYSATHYLSRASYHCVTGYNHTSGDLSRVCLETQSWSGEEPVCTIISCGEPPLIGGAKYNATGFNYSDTVTYECYLQEDEDNIVTWSRVCEATGLWTGQDGKCAAIRRKFEATPVEAKGSLAFGTVAMSILIVILVCIIILDIPTVVRQSKYLRKNVRNFKIIVRAKLDLFLNRRRWAGSRRVSVVDTHICTGDGRQSVTLSSMSLQTLDGEDDDDDGPRIHSAASGSVWSCQTSIVSLPPDAFHIAPAAECSSNTGPNLTTFENKDVKCDEFEKIVTADVEVHSLD